MDEPGEILVKSVQETIDNWVEEDDIPVYRAEGKIVADEAVLVKNIVVMAAIAVDEAAD